MLNFNYLIYNLDKAKKNIMLTQPYKLLVTLIVGFEFIISASANATSIVELSNLGVLPALLMASTPRDRWLRLPTRQVMP